MKFSGVLCLCISVVTVCILIGPSLAGNLFNDPFPNKHYNPADPNSPYGYFFFDYTTTSINNSVARGALTQDVNPYTNTVPLGQAGALDHVKVLQYHKSQFLVGKKKEIVRFNLRIGCENFGVDDHPFPAEHVTNAQDDIRLASCAMNTVDFDTMIVADFILSNKGVYAFYERLPFARTLSDNYLSFSQAKRVLNRVPSNVHDLSIEHDAKQRTLSWFVGEKRVLFVDFIGYLSDDPAVVTMLNHGGTPTLVNPTGFRAGFGGFTLLDMTDYHNPSNNGLVRLNDATGPDYVAPSVFHDELSLSQNRLWGQGTVITVESFKVENF